MANENSKVLQRLINDEMSNSFMDYAMSVIVSRALPDVRDGLKPVHRRILYAMNDLGNYPDKPYKKSARIVGDVIGKYHPHGDSSVYEAMVRMAQDFSFREMLVDGHGNFGSIDGDGAAAMRYTEARMSKIALELLKDIGKETVDFQENYDGNELEPKVLPAKVPNLLINGASGIAVGMATNIPPHNLKEVIEGTIAFSKNRNMTTSELMEYVKGPDFPLGGEILGTDGIYAAYETGTGSITVKSKYEFVSDQKRESIVIREIPYQVNKAKLIEKIALLVRDKKVDGIHDLRDESDRDGMRIVIEIKKDVSPEIVINNLLKLTPLQSRFSVNMIALDKNVPKLMTLRDVLGKYIDHQIEVIERRTRYDLKKADARAHILLGLKIAIENIDAVIKLIKESQTTDEAVKKLESTYDLTEIQSKAILDMKLQKLTGLEINKLVDEYTELLKKIEELNAILNSNEKVLEIIRGELTNNLERFESPRRSIITEGIFGDIDNEDLIEEEEVIVTLTQNGYIKRIALSEYRVQRRGGAGSRGTTLNNDDEVINIITTSTHADLLFFSDQGKVYRTRAHKIPNYSKTAKGLPLVNIIDIGKDEKITNVITIKEYSDDYNLIFVTKKGLAKKTKLSEYIKIQRKGKKAITLNEDDTVVSINLIEPNELIFIASKNGKSIVTVESNYRALSRGSKGVTAIRFKDKSDYVIGAEIISADDYILTVSENGNGKVSRGSDYKMQKRGGQGTTNLKITEKTGLVARIKKITDLEKTEIMIATIAGTVVRIPAKQIRVSGRVTQGVKIINLKENDKVSNIELLASEQEENKTDE